MLPRETHICFRGGTEKYAFFLLQREAQIYFSLEAWICLREAQLCFSKREKRFFYFHQKHKFALRKNTSILLGKKKTQQMCFRGGTNLLSREVQLCLSERKKMVYSPHEMLLMKAYVYFCKSQNCTSHECKKHVFFLLPLAAQICFAWRQNFASV